VLIKPLHAPLLLEAVLRALERDRATAPRRRARRAWEQTLQTLSRSQRQTLAALLSAPDLAALAGELHISMRAAEYRVTVLLRKLGLASRMLLWQRLAIDGAFRDAVFALAEDAVPLASQQPCEAVLLSAGCS
jgi:FixJ family two-component response regulator